MQGKATLGGQPVHPLLVTFPIGCFVTAVIADIVSVASGSPFWGAMSVWLTGLGLAGALLAAFFGFVDYLSAPMSEQARRIANMHATLNVCVVLAFGVAFAVRYFQATSIWGHVAMAAGACLLVASAILGNRLAHRHLVGSSESEVGVERHPADETSLSPTERIARDRRKARSVTKGSI